MENQTKTYQIKYQGWHNVTLTGNLLTGDTFPAINITESEHESALSRVRIKFVLTGTTAA